MPPIGCFNVLFLVHLECMYQQMKLLGYIYLTNKCMTNFCKFEQPHIKWAFGVHSHGQYTYIKILASSNTPAKWSFWNAFNWPINVGIYYKLKQLDKVNASYVYNVNKILSQFDNFQHLSMFDAWWWIIKRFFLWRVYSQF